MVLASSQFKVLPNGLATAPSVFKINEVEIINMPLRANILINIMHVCMSLRL